jgi:hypothetical protein
MITIHYSQILILKILHQLLLQLHDPSVLKGLLNYTTWNCSTSYGIEDKDGIGQALIDITCSMVDNAVK